MRSEGLARKSLAQFDDPTCKAEEEENEEDLQAAFPEPPLGEELPTDRSPQEGRQIRERFQALDVDVELSSRSKKLSAMAEWDLCPAVIEGVIDLPAVTEEEKGFHTAEG